MSYVTNYVQTRPLTDSEYRKVLESMSKDELINMVINQSHAIETLCKEQKPFYYIPSVNNAPDDDCGVTTSATTMISTEQFSEQEEGGNQDE